MFPFILNLFNKFYPFPWFFFFLTETRCLSISQWEERDTGHLLAFTGQSVTYRRTQQLGNSETSISPLRLLSQWNAGRLNWKIFISLMISFQHQQLWINFHSLSRRPIHASPLKIGLKIFYFPCNSQAMCLQIYVHL